MAAVHRTILVVDVAGFGDLRRTNQHQQIIRQALYELLAAAFDRSGVPWPECDHEDRGDGILVLIPATTAKSALVESLPAELLSALRAHNAGHPAEEQIRLRLALHAGEISYDGHGVLGRAVNLPFRLLEAPELKTALARTAGPLAMIVSAWFFDEVVWHSPVADRGRYREIRVDVKETDATAWIYLPDADERPVEFPSGKTVRPAMTPQQLPTNLRQFVGREPEIDRLTSLLDAGSGNGTVIITAIDGSAGIGKTSLALHWAHQVKHRFPDGQLHVNLRGFDPREPMDTGQALHDFLLALGVDPKAVPVALDAKAALYRSLLADRKMLILLDNARTAAHVRPLLPASPHCLVLITSRSRLDGLSVREGAHRIALDFLSPDDATALLAERVDLARLAAEPTVAGELAGLCARLPLALSIVAARAADYPNLPLGALADQLRHTRNRLDALDHTDIDLSLRAVFSWSIAALSPPAARLFRLLGLHPGPDVDRHACTALIGAESRDLLAELTAANLLTEHVPGRYRFHDLLRAYATEQAELDPRRAEAIPRMLDHYLTLAQQADHNIESYRDGPPEITTYAGAMRWFGTEAAILLALITFAAEHGYRTHAGRLAAAANRYLRRSCRWQDRVNAHRTALAAARTAGDRPSQAAALCDLGPALARLRRYAEALPLLDEAAKLHAELGNRQGLIDTHLAYSRLYEAQSDYAAALDHAQQAWDLVSETDTDRGCQAGVLTTLGRQLVLLDRDAEAQPLCEQALAHYLALDLVEGQADVLVSLGAIEQHLGRPANAVPYYERSLEIDRQLGDRYWSANVLGHLGDAHLALGNRARAEQCWQESLAILTELRHPDAERPQAKLTALLTTTTG